MKEKTREKIEDLNIRFDTAFGQLDLVTKNMFIDGVMKEDHVTREEALELIETNPMYSMGLKYACFRNRNKLDLRTPRKVKKQQFLDSLTPEEMEYYEKGPKMGFWALRKMEKEEEKKIRKQAEKLKKRMENGEEISEDDIPAPILKALKEMQG